MTQVILQPSANKAARQHYVDTIANPVLLSAHEDRISEAELVEFRGLFPSGRVPMWGVTPGKGGVNVGKWDRASVGDVVLFAAHGQIFGSGTVAAKFHNPELARRLWGVDPDGQTWEYMYALDEIRSLTIPYAEFNRVVRYKENNVIQGFTVLDEARSAACLNHFALWSTRHESEVTEEQLRDALEGLDGPLDTQVKAWARAEQSRARQALLGPAQQGQCRLCGNQYPKELLVAAHKKPRAECTSDEKRDIPAVVMLCCLFGCDALYERGYVSVDQDGGINISPHLAPSVRSMTEGRLLSSTLLTSAERDYFAWHEEHRFRG